MPDLTAANRDRARRALVASGYPIGDDGDHLERLRRTELLEAVATVDALAEQRGRDSADLAAAWDEGYASGGGDPDYPSAANPYAVPRPAGGPLDTDEPEPVEDLCAHSSGYRPDRLLDGQRTCPDCGDLEVRPVPRGPAPAVVLQDDPVSFELPAAEVSWGDQDDDEAAAIAHPNDNSAEDAAEADIADARRRDRMTWTPGDLQITPPPRPDGAP